MSAENRACPDLQDLKVMLDQSERPALRACRVLRVSAENRARPDLQDPRVRLGRSERPGLRASVVR